MSNRTRSKNYYVLATLAMSALVLQGCEDPEAVVPTNTDRFLNKTEEVYATAASILRADYLFVVDYSYSMNNKRTELLNSVQNFADDLQNSGIDYRIGFVNGNFQGTATSAEINSFTHDNFVAPFITTATSAASASLNSSILDQVADVGDPLMHNRQVPLESARKTLKARGASFLRDGAQLVLTFVSDADDTSNQYASQYSFSGTVADYVTALKSFRPAGYVSSRAIVAGVDGCALKNSYDVAGTRLAQVAKQLDASAPNALCIYNTLSLSLSSLARDVTKPTDRFSLQSAPIAATITVRVAGVDVPSAGNWTYNPSTNQILFAAGHEPGAAQQVIFNYEVPFVLSRTPKVDTIGVQVNGAAVAQGDANGWSYVAAENRIAFNGSAKPADGADVRITYQVK